MIKKIALITGGNRGLGRQSALELAARGTDVVLTYRAGKREAEAVVQEIEKKGGSAVALQLDVGQVDTLDAFVETFRQTLRSKWQKDRFDCLLNNAGHGEYAPFIETSEDQFDGLMNVHVKGPFFLTQKLLPLMNDGGKILNVTSGLTRFSFPGYAAYGVMKGALETLTSYLAKELGERRITANSIAPGGIGTDFGGGAIRDNEELRGMLTSLTALGRVGVPEDIGKLVASALSDDMRWVNGQRIEAAGGIFL